MNTKNYDLMVTLAGEQTAPNLLAARYFKPEEVYILHTDFWKSELMAERLKLRLTAMNPQLFPIDAYEPGKITQQIMALLPNKADILINITGGTKPMSIGALEAARQRGCQPLYVKSQGVKTNLDFYGFTNEGAAYIQESITIDGTISLEDYLVSYFGDEYQFTGFGKGVGVAFEQAVHQTLKDEVDEIGIGWKHKSGSVDIDLIIRCNNQVGIIEVKTGKKALTSQGIKQLAVAGGQRFFGTYTRRFLVTDQKWPQKNNNKALAEAIGIILVDLPSFVENGKIDAAEREKLAQVVHDALGKPMRAKL